MTKDDLNFLNFLRINLLVCVCLIFCSSCNSSSTLAILGTPKPTKTISPTATLSPDPTNISFPKDQATPPPFLTEIFPAPESQIPKEFYQADLMEELGTDGYEGYRSVDIFGYRSNICVYLDATYLDIWPETLNAAKAYCEYLPSTELTGYCYLSKRSTLFVNGIELMPELDTNWYPVGLVGTRGRPHWLCWPAELEEGLHQATFKIQPSPEQMEEYSWYFAITE